MKNCKDKNCKHYKRSEIIGVKCCEFGLHESYCEKDKEDFAIEELEKIKREMIEDRDSVDISCRDSFNWNIRIIDKHIAELKGIVDRIEEPVKKALSELKGEQE